MTSVKAVTHHHWKFLKEAYKLGASVDLVNDERYLCEGDRYLKFDPIRGMFNVFIHSDKPVKVRSFANMMSAVNCARRV